MKRGGRQDYEAHFKSVRAFLREWDPIGVYHPTDADDVAWPADEYDAYVPRILTLLRSGQDADGIASHLADIRTQQMGLPPDPPSDRAMAQEIVDSWNDSHG